MADKQGVILVIHRSLAGIVHVSCCRPLLPARWRDLPVRIGVHARPSPWQVSIPVALLKSEWGWSDRKEVCPGRPGPAAGGHRQDITDHCQRCQGSMINMAVVAAA